MRCLTVVVVQMMSHPKIGAQKPPVILLLNKYVKEDDDDGGDMYVVVDMTLSWQT